MSQESTQDRHANDAAAADLRVGSSDGISSEIGSVRTGVVQFSAAAYVAAMLALTLVAAEPGNAPGATWGVIIAGTIATLLTVTALERILLRIDHLWIVSDELSDRYSRARLDSLRDPLTGLGNHRAFQEELDRAAETAKRHHQSTALLLLDVDGLKRTNDTDGHAAGDQVLQTIARVIIANSRRLDRAFRIGGDEFAILSHQTTPEMALALGRRILAAALESGRRPDVGSVSVTIGISAMPEPSGDRNLLYRHADAALYWGKRHGRTDVRVYDPSVQGIADDDRPATELAAAVDRIVQDGLLTARFQPIYDLADGTCRGFEGLVRPTEGAGFRDVSAMFVAAEAVGMTVELDLAAIRQIASAARELDPDQYLTINLSPRSLEADAFNPHEVIAILGRVGIDPTRVIIELTERETVEDYERLGHNLETLRRAGVRIAADDVGAGNAGLRLLSLVSFDVLKIDMSLVQSGAIATPSRSVLKAILEIAERGGATTVAEGIESPGQLKALRELGIRVGQGYLLGLPQPRPVAAAIHMDTLLAETELNLAERLAVGFV